MGSVPTGVMMKPGPPSLSSIEHRSAKWVPGVLHTPRLVTPEIAGGGEGLGPALPAVPLGVYCAVIRLEDTLGVGLAEWALVASRRFPSEPRCESGGNLYLSIYCHRFVTVSFPFRWQLCRAAVTTT